MPTQKCPMSPSETLETFNEVMILAATLLFCRHVTFIELLRAASRTLMPPPDHNVKATESFQATETLYEA